MSIEQLAKQSLNHMHGSLASVDTALLRQMRDNSLRDCFRRMDETAHRMEHVATIHGKEYIDDAAARSVNATLYTMQRTAGPIVWIAIGDTNGADYAPLKPMALRKVCLLICIGQHTQALHQAFEGILPAVVDAQDVPSAVELAARYPTDNARIVLSPATPAGGTAEQTAHQFIRQVNEI